MESHGGGVCAGALQCQVYWQSLMALLLISATYMLNEGRLLVWQFRICPNAKVKRKAKKRKVSYSEVHPVLFRYCKQHVYVRINFKSLSFLYSGSHASPR